MINYKKIIIFLSIQFVIITYLIIKIYLDYGVILAAATFVFNLTLYLVLAWSVQIFRILEGEISVLIYINEKAYYGKIGKEMLMQKIKEKKNDLQDS